MIVTMGTHITMAGVADFHNPKIVDDKLLRVLGPHTAKDVVGRGSPSSCRPPGTQQGLGHHKLDCASVLKIKYNFAIPWCSSAVEYVSLIGITR
ncbi:hypothetical protein ACIP17_07680 [Streptomyces iakyrus]|uniref:hypothetical protein n=1 Tax=Streptomyces iakyrus TaxID=68219 RepID=UPI0038071C59